MKIYILVGKRGVGKTTLGKFLGANESTVHLEIEPLKITEAAEYYELDAKLFQTKAETFFQYKDVQVTPQVLLAKRMYQIKCSDPNYFLKKCIEQIEPEMAGSMNYVISDINTQEQVDFFMNQFGSQVVNLVGVTRLNFEMETDEFNAESIHTWVTLHPNEFDEDFTVENIAYLIAKLPQ